MPINRTPMVDDDGSGTTGTVINNAWKTELYDQIDAVLAALPPASGWVGNTTGQIPFPATPAPSANANTLDDYKEGTFTPTDGSGAGLSLTGNGTYVKIGQLITASFSVLYPANSNGNVASVLLTGLQISDGNVSGHGVALGFNDLGFAVNVALDPGTRSVNLRNASTNAQITNTQLAGHTIRGTATYRCSF